MSTSAEGWKTMVSAPASIHRFAASAISSGVPNAREILRGVVFPVRDLVSNLASCVGSGGAQHVDDGRMRLRRIVLGDTGENVLPGFSQAVGRRACGNHGP